ncbi:hypothetical protein C5O22_03380 [Treponema sp. J25]|nr:hypothetical protein C5O22_03380 [Treponema sp. J25]
MSGLWLVAPLAEGGAAGEYPFPTYSRHKKVSYLLVLWPAVPFRREGRVTGAPCAPSILGDTKPDLYRSIHQHRAPSLKKDPACAGLFFIPPNRP